VWLRLKPVSLTFWAKFGKEHNFSHVFNVNINFNLNIILSGWYVLFKGNIMDMYTPNGLSVSQLRKDAKKLKKSTGIVLSEAQDKIVRQKTPFKSWNLMMCALTSIDQSVTKFSYFDLHKNRHTFSVYKNKPLVFLYAPPGYGKSLWLAHLILNSSAINVLYCSICTVDDAFGAFRSLFDEKRELNISQHIFKDRSDDSIKYNDLLSGGLSKLIESDYDMIVIDEYARLNISEQSLQVLMDVCIAGNVSLFISSQWIEKREWDFHERYCSHVFYANSSLRKNNALFSVPESFLVNSDINIKGSTGVTHVSKIDDSFRETSFLNITLDDNFG
jgi:hypothetical protein